MLAGGSGMHTPFGGNRTPFGTGGRATPVAGSQVGGFASVPGTPFAGAAGTVSGVQTPARPGFATPAGITVSLNPNEMGKAKRFGCHCFPSPFADTTRSEYRGVSTTALGGNSVRDRVTYKPRGEGVP